MIIYARGTALIEHCETAEVFSINEDELDWEDVGDDERGMGPETHYLALVDHDELGDLRWTISEYPVGVEGTKQTNVGKHRLVEDFDYGLEHSPEFEDDPSEFGDYLLNNPKWGAALTKATVVKCLVDWFHNFYEDPANETPYNSREGGYLYIHGGPYTAEEEIRQNFEGSLSEEGIMKAVDEIQSDGTIYWAPSSQHPDQIAFYEDAVAERFEQEELDFEELHQIAIDAQPTKFGTEIELATRSGVLDQIAALKAELPKPVARGGIGHNHPPEEFELHGDEHSSVIESLDVIAVEMKEHAPNVKTVAERASFLMRAVRWVAGKANLTVDEFCKSFGKTLGIGLPAAILTSPYWGKLIALLSTVKAWLLIVLGI